MKFYFYPRLTDAGRRWFWRLCARNGRKVAYGEGYQNKRDCEATIILVRGANDWPIIELSADTEEMP